MRLAKLIAAFVFSIGLSACASITTGTTQAIAVQTTPVSGAQCELRNDKGQWLIAATPGVVTVNKAYSDISVVCQSRDGRTGTQTLQSTTAGATFGNILIGGIIGAATDMATGAAYVYPTSVAVAMSAPAPAVPQAPTETPPDNAPVAPPLVMDIPAVPPRATIHDTPRRGVPEVRRMEVSASAVLPRQSNGICKFGGVAYVNREHCLSLGGSTD